MSYLSLTLSCSFSHPIAHCAAKLPLCHLFCCRCCSFRILLNDGSRCPRRCHPNQARSANSHSHVSHTIADKLENGRRRTKAATRINKYKIRLMVLHSVCVCLCVPGYLRHSPSYLLALVPDSSWWNTMCPIATRCCSTISSLQHLLCALVCTVCECLCRIKIRSKINSHLDHPCTQHCTAHTSLTYRAIQRNLCSISFSSPLEYFRFHSTYNSQQQQRWQYQENKNCEIEMYSFRSGTSVATNCCQPNRTKAKSADIVHWLFIIIIIIIKHDEFFSSSAYCLFREFAILTVSPTDRTKEKALSSFVFRCGAPTAVALCSI